MKRKTIAADAMVDGGGFAGFAVGAVNPGCEGCAEVLVVQTSDWNPNARYLCRECFKTLKDEEPGS